jgi:hypothetical protein
LSASAGTARLLPLSHIEEDNFVGYSIRIEYSYWNYHKFSADSIITFFGADSTILFDRRTVR